MAKFKKLVCTPLVGFQTLTCLWDKISKLKFGNLFRSQATPLHIFRVLDLWPLEPSPSSRPLQPQTAHTNLTAPIPHLHRAVVGGVCSPSSRVDPAQVVHIVADKAVSCEEVRFSQQWRPPDEPELLPTTSIC